MTPVGVARTPVGVDMTPVGVAIVPRAMTPVGVACRFEAMGLAMTPVGVASVPKDLQSKSKTRGPFECSCACLIVWKLGCFKSQNGHDSKRGSHESNGLVSRCIGRNSLRLHPGISQGPLTLLISSGAAWLPRHAVRGQAQGGHSNAFMLVI